MQNLSWFESKVGSFILRGTTSVFVESLEAANKLFYLQDEKKGYLFTSPVRIHRRELEECLACGG